LEALACARGALKNATGSSNTRIVLEVHAGASASEG
jgi:hypothetical protein